MRDLAFFTWAWLGLAGLIVLASALLRLEQIHITAYLCILASIVNGVGATILHEIRKGSK